MESKPKVMTTAAWRMQHEHHLTDREPHFTKEEHPHPSGTWFKLVCPCGAKHLTNHEE